METEGMSIADIQLTAAQHAGEAAWIIIQRQPPPPYPTDYLDAYKEVYDKIYKLLSWVELDD